ncbi:MAG: 3-oxoacyl-[acyl-carrier-protein] reductase [Bacteroidaceae bacterium]|nr:3-oxoacyl-[acyl-carrier-protein] reductase [Bacteroidaceae bacterium]
MGLLTGRTVLVTGATRGIGYAMARCFIEEGAEVPFIYRTSVDRAREIEEEFQAKGAKVKGYRLDIASFEEVSRTISQIVADFGKIDVLVNNAGITRDGLSFRLSEEAWDEVIDTNLKSAFNCIHACVPTMLRQRSGCILSVTSIVGMHGNAGQASYAASKSGLVGLTKSVAKELASRGIRANLIAPGFIRTEMTEKVGEDLMNQWIKDIPMQRAGTPEEVAKAALFLISDNASYITGQVLAIDGGKSM